MPHTNQPEIYGLLGRKLSHSFSKAYFTQKFEQLGRNAVYKNFELEQIMDFPQVLANNKLQGLNVTIPYKESVIPFLNSLSDEAREIGAVNTIVFHEGVSVGHNTDAFGFQQMIKPFLMNTHERALILGNGGAARAVKYVLKKIGLDVLFATRNPKPDEFHLSEVNALMIKHCGLIVNTTPVGTYPDIEAQLKLPYEALTEGHLVVDLIYNPEETAFLKSAKKYGATTLNGLTMLHQQAEKSWALWNQKG